MKNFKLFFILVLTLILISCNSEVKKIDSDNSDNINATESKKEAVVLSGDLEEEFKKISLLEQLNYVDKSTAKEIDGRIVLYNDVVTNNTLYVNNDSMLDLNNHYIKGEDCEVTININPNIKFSVTNNQIINNDYENNTEVQNGYIASVGQLSAIYAMENSTFTLDNGVIMGAENADAAVYLINANFIMNNGIVWGSDGTDDEDGRGYDGRTGVIANFDSNKYKITFNGGFIVGGNGGKGSQGKKSYGGAALSNYYSLFSDEKVENGYDGDPGCGNGGDGIYLSGDYAEFDSVIINSYGINGGDGGTISEYVSYDGKTDFTSTYDGRKEGYITKPMEQGGTYLCFSFSVIKAAEAYMMKNYPDYVRSLGYESFNDFKLSESQNAYFLRHPVADPLNNAGEASFKYSGEDDYFGLGANNVEEAIFLSKYTGMVDDKYVTDTIEEYLDNDKIIKLDDDITKKTAVHIDDYYKYDLGRYEQDDFVNLVKDKILEYGGVILSSYTDDDDAVIEKVEYNGEVYATYNRNTNNKDGRHAMYIFGWDDNFPKENFANPTNIKRDGGFLMQNSWYSDRYTFIPYDWVLDDASITCFSFIPAYENYNNVYFYDNGISDDYVVSNDITSIANTFTIKNDNEKLRKVTYIAGDDSENTRMYIVKSDIFTNDYFSKVGYKASGDNMISDISNSVVYSDIVNIKEGYNSINIETDLELEKGATYTVILSCDEGFKWLIMDYNTKDSDGEFITTYNKNNFVYHNDTGMWHELNVGLKNETIEGNIRIKLVTDSE